MARVESGGRTSVGTRRCFHRASFELQRTYGDATSAPLRDLMLCFATPVSGRSFWSSEIVTTSTGSSLRQADGSSSIARFLDSPSPDSPFLLFLPFASLLTSPPSLGLSFTRETTLVPVPTPLRIPPSSPRASSSPSFLPSLNIHPFRLSWRSTTRTPSPIRLGLLRIPPP